MINPIRRLVYEILLQPIINVVHGVIDLTTGVLHRLPLHSRRVERRPYLWRWQNEVRSHPRST
jgi:hypothetical protein